MGFKRKGLRLDFFGFLMEEDVNTGLLVPKGFGVINGGEELIERLQKAYEAWERRAVNSITVLEYALYTAALRSETTLYSCTRETVFGQKVWWAVATLSYGEAREVVVYINPPMGILKSEIRAFQRGGVTVEMLEPYVEVLCKIFDGG